MPDPLLAYVDLEAFLVSWYRVALAARPEDVTDGVAVDRVEPGPHDTWPARLVVIRDDGTTDDSFITGSASVGVTVYAGTKQRPDEAKDLARIVHALASQIPSADPSNPVAVVRARTSPVLVPESQPRAAAYFPLILGVVSRPL